MTKSDLNFKRKERKYLVLENNFAEITSIISEHIPISIFNGEDSISIIETTYLDTKDHLLFREYLNKRPFRFKIRLRRYGNSNGFEPIYMVELKMKYEGISSKRRFSLPSHLLKDFLKGKNIKDEIKKANKGVSGVQKSYKLINELMKLNGLCPVMRSRYERIAFQKKSKRIRLTLDRNIVHEKLNGAPKFENLDAIILESKVMGKTPKWQKKLVNKLSLLRQNRFSKYATGMNSLYYPTRGKYNFTDEGFVTTEIAECINKSFELINSKLKFAAKIEE